MIRDYELGLVINPDLTDEEIDAVIMRVGQAAETRGGQITRLDRWGRRRLAYPIAKHRDGYYAYFELQLDSSMVREVERVVLVNEDIMRHLVMALDPRMREERRRRQEQELARQAQLAAQAAQRAEAAQARSEAQAAAEVPVAETEAATAQAEPSVATETPIPAPSETPEATLATPQPATETE